jgi:hypothetical protein
MATAVLNGSENKPTIRKTRGPRKNSIANVTGGGELAGRLFIKPQLLQVLCLSEAAWRAMKRGGLKTIPQHGHVYIRGDDVLAYFAKLAGDVPVAK